MAGIAMAVILKTVMVAAAATLLKMSFTRGRKPSLVERVFLVGSLGTFALLVSRVTSDFFTYIARQSTSTKSTVLYSVLY
jgi:hypothetical protein